VELALEEPAEARRVDEEPLPDLRPVGLVQQEAERARREQEADGRRADRDLHRPRARRALPGEEGRREERRRRGPGEGGVEARDGRDRAGAHGKIAPWITTATIARAASTGSARAAASGDRAARAYPPKTAAPPR